MNFLDKTINYFSPKLGLERAKYRQCKNAYEAANPSRVHKAKRESLSANNLVSASALSLREQARSLDQNHDIVIGILDKLEERVIGAKGIHVEPQPLNKDGDIDEELAHQIRKAWAEWSVKPEVTGRFTRPQLERLLLRAYLRDGEVFAQMVKGYVTGFKYPTRIPFAIEALEADFVPLNLNVTDEDKNVVQGIHLNDWRQPVKYEVYKINPLEQFIFNASQTKTISAENMLHLFFTKRLHQVRGVSMLHGVISRLSDIKEYEESERVAARVAAALTMYIKKGDSGSFEENNFNAEAKLREFELAPGAVIDDLAPGEDIGLVKSDRPNTGLESFRSGQLRAVASGVRVSYSSIAKDYNGTYSSQRQELVEANEGYNILQDNFVAHVSRKIYREWLKMALVSGEIKYSKNVDEKTLYNAVYLGPVMPWIDPLKETKAWKEQIIGGGATQSEWIRSRGANPSEVMKQRHAEIKKNNELGLRFDTDVNNTNNKEQINEKDMVQDEGSSTK